ncbi:MAG: hypothetical protein HYR86_02675, partial [Candidatus Rokubacteria bacterium]|nr:hypothetical protein [Candidatus Rokubacteria bacterium]
MAPKAAVRPLNTLRAALVCLLIGSVAAGPAAALPQNGQVSAGQVTMSQAGTTLTVTQVSDKAIINWRGFSIDVTELVRFLQPGSSAVA